MYLLNITGKELLMPRNKLFLRFLHLRVVGVCIFLFGLYQNCVAQDTTLKPGTDTALINRLLDIAHRQSDPDSAIRLYDRPLQLSIAGNYTKGAINALNSLSHIYFRKNDLDKCLQSFKRELSLSRTAGQKANCLYAIGNFYYRQGNVLEASEYLYSGLKELQNSKVLDGESARAYSVIYNLLALINIEIKQDSNTLYYLNKAEGFARNGKLDYQLVVIFMNKSTYYKIHKKFDSSIIYLLNAQTISEKDNFNDKKSEIDEGLGSVYLEEGANEKAITCFKSGIDSAKLRYSESPDYMRIFSSYGIGEALYGMGKYRQAEEVIVPALKKAAALKMNGNVVDVYTTLAKVYKAMGQYKKALDCMDSINVINDSLTSVEKAAAINQMEIKYKTAEKDKQLSRNQLIIAQQNNKIARKNLWMLSIGGSLLLLLLVSGGVYLQAVNRQKSLEKENKIGILKAAVAGGDNERTRIARELHDGIGGMLSAAMMRFSSMHHEEPAITRTAAYTDAMNILREMGDEIRKTAHNLMPEVLLKQSLPEAVRIYSNNVQEAGSLKIDFQSYGLFDSLSQGYKLNIYRIIQELIKNVTVHAHADHVLVQLLQNENKLMVSVEDNGSGFDVHEVKGGMGLNNIRTRVSSLDGLFTLESKPGKGTTVIIEFETPDPNGEHQFG